MKKLVKILSYLLFVLGFVAGVFFSRYELAIYTIAIAIFTKPSEG